MDTDNHWLLTLAPDVTATARAGGPGDLSLTGNAADLYLALWNRGDDSAINIIGDADVRHANIHIRWGEDAE
ncbi:MAG: hypothetical protein ACRBK7_30425 [Acidimicrobiales bacterium]